jgi:hypothetical protein
MSLFTCRFDLALVSRSLIASANSLPLVVRNFVREQTLCTHNMKAVHLTKDVQPSLSQRYASPVPVASGYHNNNLRR